MANKLSEAQEKVLIEAKRDIDIARSMSFYDWLRTTNPCFKEFTNEEIDDRFNVSFYRDLYEDNKTGIAHTYCNGKIIEELEKLGLIEIIYNDLNKIYSFAEHVKVLNY